MTDRTSNLDLARSLEHLAGAMRAVLAEYPAADMRVTSEDARDIQRAAEVIRLYRLARPTAETLDEHDAGIIRDLEAMAKDQLAGFWPQALAIGALRLIRRAQKTVAEPDPLTDQAGRWEGL